MLCSGLENGQFEPRPLLIIRSQQAIINHFLPVKFEADQCDQTVRLFKHPSKKPPSPKPFPRKIWQSWKNFAAAPNNQSAGYPRAWQVANPGWEYERLTDANNHRYVRTNFDNDTSDIFNNITDPILKADFLRYLILLHDGGAWADIDVYPNQPVSSWVPGDFGDKASLVVGIERDYPKGPLWSKSPYPIQLCQYAMLAKPDHPAMKSVVENVTQNIMALEETQTHFTDDDVVRTTGSFAFTQVLMDYLSEKNGTIFNSTELVGMKSPILIDDVVVLPRDSFGWLPEDHRLMKGDSSILATHLFMGSWKDSHLD